MIIKILSYLNNLPKRSGIFSKGCFYTAFYMPEVISYFSFQGMWPIDGNIVEIQNHSGIYIAQSSEGTTQLLLHMSTNIKWCLR